MAVDCLFYAYFFGRDVKCVLVCSGSHPQTRVQFVQGDSAGCENFCSCCLLLAG